MAFGRSSLQPIIDAPNPAKRPHACIDDCQLMKQPPDTISINYGWRKSKQLEFATEALLDHFNVRNSQYTCGVIFPVCHRTSHVAHSLAGSQFGFPTSLFARITANGVKIAPLYACFSTLLQRYLRRVPRQEHMNLSRSLWIAALASRLLGRNTRARNLLTSLNSTAQNLLPHSGIAKLLCCTRPVDCLWLSTRDS
jgi:hypothetical protein